MCLAINRVSTFTFVEFYNKAGKMNAATFLEHAIEAFPYKSHTVLTDNGIAFAALPKKIERLQRDTEVYTMYYNLTRGQLDKPADAGIVDGLSACLGVALPGDYLDFLGLNNGGEGFIGDHYIIFWKAEELASFNREYEVEKYAPGILLFGSNGGGEGYGFDAQIAEAMPIVRIPFIGMQRCYARRVAKSLPDLFTQLGGRSMSNNSATNLPHGMELVEITPIILGGSPTDLQNKNWVTRQQHFELVRYWNRVISDHRKHGWRTLE